MLTCSRLASATWSTDGRPLPWGGSACSACWHSAGQQRLTYDSGHRGNVFQARAFPATGLAVVVTCAADGQVSTELQSLIAALRHPLRRRKPWPRSRWDRSGVLSCEQGPQDSTRTSVGRRFAADQRLSPMDICRARGRAHSSRVSTLGEGPLRQCVQWRCSCVAAISRATARACQRHSAGHLLLGGDGCGTGSQSWSRLDSGLSANFTLTSP